MKQDGRQTVARMTSDEMNELRGDFLLRGMGIMRWRQALARHWCWSILHLSGSNISEGMAHMCMVTCTPVRGMADADIQHVRNLLDATSMAISPLGRDGQHVFHAQALQLHKTVMQGRPGAGALNLCLDGAFCDHESRQRQLSSIMRRGRQTPPASQSEKCKTPPAGQPDFLKAARLYADLMRQHFFAPGNLIMSNLLTGQSFVDAGYVPVFFCATQRQRLAHCEAMLAGDSAESHERALIEMSSLLEQTASQIVRFRRRWMQAGSAARNAILLCDTGTIVSAAQAPVNAARHAPVF